MPFSTNWSDAVPQGAFTRASSIDEVIRELKVQIRERMEQITDWPGDEEDGTLFMDRNTARVGVGLKVDRPAVPTGVEGEVYYASDTNEIFVTKESDGDTGEPVPQGELYWVEQPVTVDSRFFAYNDTLAAGTKITDDRKIVRIVSFSGYGQVSDDAEGAGWIEVDFNELDPVLDVNLFSSLVVQALSANRSTMGWQKRDGNRIRFFFIDTSQPDEGTPMDTGEFITFHAIGTVI